MAESREVRILADSGALFQAAADDFVGLAQAAVASKGSFAVALSGGSTPRGMFQLLASRQRSALPWEKMFFFWSDERHVPPDHPDSNFRMAQEALLSKVPVPAANVFRVPAEDPVASRAAERYERTIREFFRLADGAFPHFDLILLGMGPDGHTASLFPETKALSERSRLVVANWVEKFNTDRITFTVPTLNAAHAVEFLVAGSDKAPALHEVLEGSQSSQLFPAKLVQPADGTLVWLVDTAASAQLAGSRA